MADGGIFYLQDERGTLWRTQHSGHGAPTTQWHPRTRVSGQWASYVQLFGGNSGVIYGIDDNGILHWHRHAGYLSGDDRVEGPKPVGEGWTRFPRAWAAPGGILYACDEVGDLFWFQHEGFRDGTARWKGPLKVASGWDVFHNVLLCELSIILATSDTQWLWFQHRGADVGTREWLGGHELHGGFPAGAWRRLYGGSGVIYDIDSKGEVMHNRFANLTMGASGWTGEGWTKVASGWNTYVRIL